MTSENRNMEHRNQTESEQCENQSESDIYDASPPYELRATGELLQTSSTIRCDGRFDIELSSKHPAELRNLLPRNSAPPSFPYDSHQPYLSGPQSNCPPLNLVIQVVGSRGDVQPFIAYGTALQRYGHRVRIATHNNFADFVRQSGLEFYPIGGDPADLMSYMVRNPGLIPSIESMRQGDVGKKRRMIKEMLNGCWRACFCPDPVTDELFVANAIIANPPSFAHVHCAQALGVPAHIMFTMPWTATRAFPHPLANLKTSNAGSSSTNWLSYGIVELMTWQGLGDVINEWRRQTLGLEPIPESMGPGITTYFKIPHTYCWSPAIVPKPADWGSEINVCGFFLRDEPEYKCPPDLDAFLRAGPPPVYVGFGSIVIEDPVRLTDIILEATARHGLRVIISRGWSKLGGDCPNTEQAFYLDDCPHEWLFKRVSVVVHHGGAGTTACGLVNARPTIIVPFFGDQPFWGEVVASVGAGSAPIPQQQLTATALATALQHCLEPQVACAAEQIAVKMRVENGVHSAVQSFHQNLPLSKMTCDALPQYTATWRLRSKGRDFKLSDVAAAALIASKRVRNRDLQTLEVQTYDTDVNRWDPITGGASSVLGTMTDMTLSLGKTFVDPFTAYKHQRRQRQEQGTEGSVGSSAGSAALAASRGLIDVHRAMIKGGLVDLPLALAEGLRNAPRLYGAEADDYGRVRGWKSGTVVGGKALGMGLYNGVSGLATEPYRGMKEEGAVGFLKGVGKGSIGLVTKTGTASVGLFAYPAQGICKTMRRRKDQALQQQRLTSRARATACLTPRMEEDISRWYAQALKG